MNLNKILIIIIAILIIWLILPKCESPVKSSKDLQSKVDSTTLVITDKQIRVDTIEVERTKIVHHYHTLRDTLNIHDTVQVIRFVAVTDSVIKVDSTEIVLLKSLNKDYSNLVSMKDTQLNDAKIELHLTKKRNRKRVFVGIGSGAIVGLIGGLLLTR